MVIGSDKPELSDLSGFYTLLFLVCTLWVCISTVTSAIKLSNCRQELAEVSLIFHILQLPMATLLRVSSSPHQFCLRVSVKLECVSTNQHPEVRWKTKVSTYLISTFCVCVGVFCNFFFFFFTLFGNNNIFTRLCWCFPTLKDVLYVMHTVRLKLLRSMWLRVCIVQLLAAHATCCFWDTVHSLCTVWDIALMSVQLFLLLKITGLIVPMQASYIQASSYISQKQWLTSQSYSSCMM